MAVHCGPSEALATTRTSLDEDIVQVNNQGTSGASGCTITTKKIGVTMRVIERVAADPRIGLPLIDVAEVNDDGAPLYTEKALNQMSIAALKKLGEKHAIGPTQPAQARKRWCPRLQRRARRSANSVRATVTVDNESQIGDQTRIDAPRGRDNFDWEHADIQSKSAWIQALRQPLESTAQVCEYIIRRDTADRRESYADALLRKQGGEAGSRSGVGPATRFVSHAWSYEFRAVAAALSQFALECKGAAAFQKFGGVVDAIRAASPGCSARSSSPATPSPRINLRVIGQTSSDRALSIAQGNHVGGGACGSGSGDPSHDINDDANDEFFWFDIMVLNQHDVRDFQLPSSYWTTTFRDLIRDIGSTVLVVSPWQNPEPMRRSWILWELHCTHSTSAAATEDELQELQKAKRHRTKDHTAPTSIVSTTETMKEQACRFTVALPPNEMLALQKALADSDQSTRGVLHRVFGAIDARNATASHESDRKHINEAIAATEGGFAWLNMQVMQRMRMWVELTGTAYIDQLRLRAETTSVTPPKRKLAVAACNFAVLLKDLNRLDLALRFYRMALQVQRKLDGDHGADTLNTTHCIATLLRKQGGMKNLQEAERLSRAVLEGKLLSLGPKHKDTLRTQHALATILREQIVMSDDSKSQVSTMRKPQATNASEQQRRLHEAEKLFVQALEGRKELLGATHADTLRSMVNLGQLIVIKQDTEMANANEVALVTLEDFENFESAPCGQHVARATRLYRAAHKSEMEILGPRHSKTAKTATLLATVLDRAAAALHQKAWQESHKDLLSSTSAKKETGSAFGPEVGLNSVTFVGKSSAQI
eukprot:g1780.t1